MANISELSVKVNVDVSEAISGLKAVQREAKKATQALAELKAAQETLCIE
jgi:phage-related minor tail protein